MSLKDTLVTQRDMVDFASNYNPTTDSILDQLVPNEKTQNIEQAYIRAKKNQYTQMAEVHAEDTEAKIATRAPFSVEAVKKFLIKEKIALNEEYARLADELKDNSVVRDYIFNDAGNMSDRVRTRTLAMKGEMISTGKVTVKENNLNITVDFKVPAGNFSSVSWATAGSRDILGDIKTVVDNANSKGYKLTRAVTSSTIMSLIQMDANIRSALYGANATKIPSVNEVNAFLYEQFGVRFVTFDDMYIYETATGVRRTNRYIPENKICFFGGAVTETIGKGLYGITPEERNARLNVSQSKNIYIMNTIWDENDPVATWTKASAMFVPVLADPDNLFVMTVTLPV